MKQCDLLDLASTIASYVVEQEVDQYPYRISETGEVVYTDTAQQRFNEHFDVIEQLLKHSLLRE